MINNKEIITDVVLGSLMLTLNIFIFFSCFYCCLWTGKCMLVAMKLLPMKLFFTCPSISVFSRWTGIQWPANPPRATRKVWKINFLGILKLELLNQRCFMINKIHISWLPPVWMSNIHFINFPQQIPKAISCNYLIITYQARKNFQLYYIFLDMQIDHKEDNLTIICPVDTRQSVQS